MFTHYMEGLCKDSGAFPFVDLRFSNSSSFTDQFVSFL